MKKIKNNIYIYIYSDLYRITGKTSKANLIKAMLNPEFKYMFFFRMCNHYIISSKNFIVKRFYKIILRHYSIKYGYEIEPGCKIDYGFRLVHRGGVAINPNAVIGKNCTVFKGATIGSQRRGKNKGAPVIADNVWIGANSTIVGKVFIGKNVLIAPNSYVNCDIPPNSIVIGCPAQVIHRENATEGYIDNPIKENEEIE